MTEPPGQPVLDNVAHVAPSGGNAGHRRDVIGFERVLHSEQKAKPQYSEHAFPDFNLATSGSAEHVRIFSGCSHNPAERRYSPGPLWSVYRSETDVGVDRMEAEFTSGAAWRASNSGITGALGSNRTR